MTVEVAVEQFNSFISGRVPTSGDMASKKGAKQGGAGQGYAKIQGKSHASRFGLGVDVGARINSPQVDGAGDQVGNEEMVDFGKKKKRLKATLKL
ncbi:unnamed protein product [Calypogeia fissa]